MRHATMLSILSWVTSANVYFCIAQQEESIRLAKDVREDTFIFYDGINRNQVFFEVVVNTTSSKVIDCVVYSNRQFAAQKLALKAVTPLSTVDYSAKIAICESVTAAVIKKRLQVSRNNLRPSSNFLKVLGNHAYSTYPGTKWCGTGTLALNSTDLGSLKDIDECCHTHASCSESLYPGESKEGLQNLDFYARRFCRCDQQLFRCLKNLAPDEDADLVGHLYFNVLQIECFDHDFPRTCSSFDEDGFCRTYSYPKNMQEKARYQWFSNPPFKREKKNT